MIVLLMLVLSLLFMLSAFKFQTVLTKLIANRLSATSPTIYESIEDALDLGCNAPRVSGDFYRSGNTAAGSS